MIGKFEKIYINKYKKCRGRPCVYPIIELIKYKNKKHKGDIMHKINKRKSIRLKEYDYSQNGAYFITICTKDRKNVLSNINTNVSEGWASTNLTKIGKLVNDIIIELKDNLNIEINYYVIMPNHIHMIIEIDKNKRVNTRYTSTLPNIICYLKSKTTVKYNKESNISNKKLWQRNYYEHIIRDEKEMEEIIKYIINNPINWDKDVLNM